MGVGSVLRSVLFVEDMPLVKAICDAGNDGRMFRFGVEAIGLPWVCDFMVDQLFTVKRDHFEELRDFAAYQMCGNPGSIPRLEEGPPPRHQGGWRFLIPSRCIKAVSSFDQVWLRLLQRTEEIAIQSGKSYVGDPQQLLSLHQIMGHYLWYYHRSEYMWSLNGLPATYRTALERRFGTIPFVYTCPTLSVAKHTWVRVWDPHDDSANPSNAEENDVLSYFAGSPDVNEMVQNRRAEKAYCLEHCGKLQKPFVDHALLLLSQGHCLELQAQRGDTTTDCRLQLSAHELLVRIDAIPRTVSRWCAWSRYGNQTQPAMVTEHLALVARRWRE